ncbi:zinc transporter ZIP13 isoform X6 [Marmota flaviventris]|uniref:zinc transporter ZIP13 isoform X6 n=1 Tax=Marmota flaviventris TaxID=93162 RepID=UPI003A86A61E
MAGPARNAAAAAAAAATAAAARTRHAWMSLLWLWHGGPKAPLPHCPCPRAPGKGWGVPASPPELGSCSSLSPGQQRKRVLGDPVEHREARHLDLLPPGLTHAGARRLKQLLSFALGGLLGNVFLHLLPEAWAYTCSSSPGGEGQSLQQQQQLGLWVIAGFLTFLALEKMFLDSKKEGANQAPSKDPTAAALNGGHCLAQPAAEPGLRAVVRNLKVSGYLNLLANTIDNFTHGLAVAASFLVSKKIGLLTTMAILLHEIPHEPVGGMGDESPGLSSQASSSPAEETVAWILPFTSGGFLYIALVNVLPDLLEEDDPWRSLQQVLLLCSGITVMALLSLCVE